MLYTLSYSPIKHHLILLTRSHSSLLELRLEKNGLSDFKTDQLDCPRRPLIVCASEAWSSAATTHRIVGPQNLTAPIIWQNNAPQYNCNQMITVVMMDKSKLDRLVPKWNHRRN